MVTLEFGISKNLAQQYRIFRGHSQFTFLTGLRTNLGSQYQSAFLTAQLVFIEVIPAVDAHVLYLPGQEGQDDQAVLWLPAQLQKPGELGFEVVQGRFFNQPEVDGFVDAVQPAGDDLTGKISPQAVVGDIIADQVQH
mgnify:FL=1